MDRLPFRIQLLQNQNWLRWIKLFILQKPEANRNFFLILLSEEKALLFCRFFKWGKVELYRSLLSDLAIKQYFLLHYKKTLLYPPFLKKLRSWGILADHTYVMYYVQFLRQSWQILTYLPVDIHKEMNKQKPKRKHYERLCQFEGWPIFPCRVICMYIFPAFIWP